MHEDAGDACAEQVAQSGLLRGLDPATGLALMPFLESVRLEPGTALLTPGAPIRHLYFPRSAIVSICQPSLGGELELALVGAEGFVGWSALLGWNASVQAATVDIQAGTALRLRTEDALLLAASHPPLFATLLRFVEVTIVQIGSAMAVQACHSAQQRVARWLLMRHDRVPGDELTARHDQIGLRLGLRRASVTDALHVIEGDRFVRCHRGQIRVIDRAGLERFADGAYGTAERHYREVIGPFGKLAAAGSAGPSPGTATGPSDRPVTA